MIDQLEDIYPSANAPLYRRIISDEGLSYLREDEGIIGFELDLEKDQHLSGFLLLAIQKHTVYAFKSDLHEEPKLILFPPLDKLFDSTFEMLDLKVVRKKYLSNDFVGKELGRGSLRELARELTPPEKDIDLPEDVSELMVQELERVQSEQVTEKKVEKVVVEPTPVEMNEEVMEEPSMNELMDEPDMNNFDDYESGFDDFEEGYEDEYEEDFEEEITDWRIKELKENTFNNLSDLGEFVELRLNVPKAVSTQVLNKALQSQVVADKKMESQDLAILLFNKLFEDGKL